MNYHLHSVLDHKLSQLIDLHTDLSRVYVTCKLRPEVFDEGLQIFNNISMAIAERLLELTNDDSPKDEVGPSLRTMELYFNQLTIRIDKLKTFRFDGA